MTEKKTEKTASTQKFGKQEVYTNSGIDYTFQFPGTRMTQEILDSAKVVGNVFSDTRYHEQLMEHVIVAPKTSFEYFDEHDGYREVMAAADRFLGGLL